MFGAPAGGSVGAVEVHVVEEVHAADHHALLGGGLTAQHARAIRDTGVLLDHVIAGAGGQVPAVRPHRGTRIVGKERADELIAIPRAGGIVGGAHGITHGIGTRVARRRRTRTDGVGDRCRHVQRDGRPRLRGAVRPAGHRRRTGRRGGRIIGVPDTPLEHRDHHQPALRELVVSCHGIPAVACLARAAGSAKERVGGHRPVEHASGAVEACAAAREDGEARVHDLHDVVDADRERVVRRIAQQRPALRPAEAVAEAIERLDEQR